MITKTIDITVDNGYKISLSSPIEFYVGDKVKLIFNLYGLQVNLNNIVPSANGINKLEKINLNGLRAKLIHETPSNEDSIKSATVEDNSISFIVGDELTGFDGNYRCQIILKDNDDYQVTLPPFGYLVKPNIYDNLLGDEIIFATKQEIIDSINEAWN